MKAVGDWLLALADVAGPSGRARQAKGSLPDGPVAHALINAAAAHGVLPALAANLRQLAAARQLDIAGIDETLDRRLRAAAGWCLACQAQGAHAAAKLAAAGIASMILKGPSFARRLYQPAMRTFQDVDLLVPADAAEAACNAMASCGYEPVACSPRHQAIYGQRAFRPAGNAGGPCVEIHWDLVNSPVLRRAVSVGWSDVERDDAGEPTPQSLLLIAAVHGATSHSFSRLGILVDVAQCCRGVAGAVDAGRLAELARSGGAELCVRSALWAAGRYLGEPACMALLAEAKLAPPPLAARAALNRRTILGSPPGLAAVGRNAFRQMLKKPARNRAAGKSAASVHQPAVGSSQP